MVTYWNDRLKGKEGYQRHHKCAATERLYVPTEENGGRGSVTRIPWNSKGAVINGVLQSLLTLMVELDDINPPNSQQRKEAIALYRDPNHGYGVRKLTRWLEENTSITICLLHLIYSVATQCKKQMIVRIIALQQKSSY